jgi:parvulin-like peptidyl-prolyl isomerase
VSLNEPADQLFADTRTVAYVNGEPILASEVLEPYAEKLSELRQQVPPEQFEQLRLQLIERDLPIQIDNRLLIQGFKSTLKKPQQDMLDQAVATMFNKEIEKLKAQFDVNTDYELEVELQKKNSSLASLERAFGNRVMASEFLRSKAGSIREPSRREMLEAYERRKQDEYHRPARVRWQQILISYGANGGKQGAIETLTKAAQELRQGTDFSEVAKTYSDGPGAAQGGYWDWMQRGSLADQAVEEELFSMPVGRISDVLVGESSFQLVRVLEREDERYIPFEKVQDALKDELKEEYQKAATERVMQELRANAVIQTMFDEPELTETEADTETEITPISFQAPESSPFGRGQAEPNPFAETEASASRQSDNPFAQMEASASRESGNPITNDSPSDTQHNPFADESSRNTDSEPSSFESFTEKSPFE